jgi:hypothetical protein
MSDPFQIDRRTTIKWVIAAAASLPAIRRDAFAEGNAAASAPAAAAKGYGTDPDLTRIYAPGDLWPLTFTAAERRTATVLCDLILPADSRSPGASAVGVVDFIDEWISAPYQDNAGDRKLILEGFRWLDTEAMRRFGHGFADSGASSQATLCDEICCLPKSDARLEPAARFFARYRDLTVGGFYTTPEGMRDLGYVGNVALARFDGPPPEVLRKVGLEGEGA